MALIWSRSDSSRLLCVCLKCCNTRVGYTFCKRVNLLVEMFAGENNNKYNVVLFLMLKLLVTVRLVSPFTIHGLPL